MTEKHQAACRLLQASQEMQALLTPETDGTLLCEIARNHASNARVIELLTRPETQDQEDDDEDETDEGMFDPEGDE